MYHFAGKTPGPQGPLSFASAVSVGQAHSHQSLANKNPSLCCAEGRVGFSVGGVCVCVKGGLFSGVCVCVCVCICAWLCPTRYDPMDYSLPVSSVLGIFQAGILEWLPFPTPGDLPDPGTELASPRTSALAGRFFTTGATSLMLFPDISCF